MESDHDRFERTNRFKNSMFDYKTTYDITKKSTRYDIAKDLAASATSFGGTIIGA